MTSVLADDHLAEFALDALVGLAQFLDRLEIVGCRRLLGHAASAVGPGPAPRNTKTRAGFDPAVAVLPSLSWEEA